MGMSSRLQFMNSRALLKDFPASSATISSPMAALSEVCEVPSRSRAAVRWSARLDPRDFYVELSIKARHVGLANPCGGLGWCQAGDLDGSVKQAPDSSFIVQQAFLRHWSHSGDVVAKLDADMVSRSQAIGSLWLWLQRLK